jgi:hypothetical protein
VRRDVGPIRIISFSFEQAEADYFPKIGSTFVNMHFNKFTGETVQLARRSAALPLINKDQTMVAFTVTQPLTPIFKIKEVVDIGPNH